MTIASTLNTFGGRRCSRPERCLRRSRGRQPPRWGSTSSHTYRGARRPTRLRPSGVSMPWPAHHDRNCSRMVGSLMVESRASIRTLETISARLGSSSGGFTHEGGAHLHRRRGGFGVDPAGVGDADDEVEITHSLGKMTCGTEPRGWASRHRLLNVTRLRASDRTLWLASPTRRSTLEYHWMNRVRVEPGLR